MTVPNDMISFEIWDGIVFIWPWGEKKIDIYAQMLSSNQASLIQITRKYVQNV